VSHSCIYFSLWPVSFLYSCFKKIIVSFLHLKSFLCVCVTESMSWLPGATVGPEADTGHCSDAGGSPHHDCSETTTQNAHWGMKWNHIGMIPSFVGPATLYLILYWTLSWILLLILFWCIVFESLELCWSTRLFQGLCAAVKSLDKLWHFPVVKKRIQKLILSSKKVWKCYVIIVFKRCEILSWWKKETNTTNMWHTGHYKESLQQGCKYPHG